MIKSMCVSREDPSKIDAYLLSLFVVYSSKCCLDYVDKDFYCSPLGGSLSYKEEILCEQAFSH